MTYELICNDVLAAFPGLLDASVDVVVTSPPYNLKKKYRRCRDNMARSDYLHWTAQWCRQIARVLKPGGSFFLNMGSYSKWPTQAHDVVHLLTTETRMFVLQNTFHWIKSITVGEKSHGHFTPVSSSRYVNHLHEYVFHLTPAGNTKLDRLALGVPYEDKSNVNRWGHTGGRDLRCRGNVWFIPYKTIQLRQRDRPHPATFPPTLATNCVRLHAGEDLVVLDPFLGLGNAAVGAHNSGKCRHFVGFDFDDYYIEESLKTLKKTCS